jgi:adenylate cyclase
MRLLNWMPMHTRRLLVGLLVTALAVLAEVSNVGLPLDDALDRMLYDMRVRAQPAKPNSRVLIVDIDDRSLAEQGSWPWPRDRMSRLTEIVASEGGARAVGLNFVFAEPQPRVDERFARVLQSAPIVLGYHLSHELGVLSYGQLPSPAFAAASLKDRTMQAGSWSGYGANTPQIARSALASGFFNTNVDQDGVLRSMPLMAEFQGNLYESIAVSLLKVSFGNYPVTIHTDGAGRHTLGFGANGQRALIPVSADMTALVPFQGKSGSQASRFRYVSATDVLQGRIEPRLFRDRIVLVGTTAHGLTEPRNTPLSTRYPVIEIQASMIAGALEGSFRTEAPYEGALEIGLIATLGISAAIAMAGCSAIGVIGLTVLGMSVLTAWNMVAYTQFGWVMPLACGILTLWFIAIANIVASYLIEGRARRAVIGLFGQYVAPQLVERMTDNPHDYPLESQDKELTILFADIRGFTRMAESMDPLQLRDFLNRFLTTMTEVIHAYDGTVDKYIGDAVMAFWGAPIDDPHHADRAVSAALAMQQAVGQLNAEFAAIGLPRITVGIGINTGIVRVGDMGSRLRRSYTVIGDAVNLAARFEGLSKRFGVPIIVGDATRLAVRSIALQFVARADIPGRTEPVGVWQPVQLDAHVPRVESDAGHALFNDTQGDTHTNDEVQLATHPSNRAPTAPERVS